MPNSEVPRVELNGDGTLTLQVMLGGFDPGTPVEISGQVTQNNGAIVASFYSIVLVPETIPGTNPGTSIVYVKGVIPASGTFDAQFPMMVVARAAEIWISPLEQDTSAAALTSEENPGGPQLQAAWTVTNPQWAVAPTGEKAPAWVSSSAPPGALIRHGTWWDGIKRQPLDVVMGGRFTRLFPDLPAASFPLDALKALARAMIAPTENPVPEPGSDPEENPGIPAAYTYLGQFADHDLTFDPSSSLREALTPAQLRALVDFRTPRFDLDNLYGHGPDDQPYLYEDDGIRMLLGLPLSGNPFDPGAVQPPRGPNGRALIGDPRNDENRIIAQLHTIFLRFHNKVVDQFSKKDVTFEKVREQVRWHYQWILVNNFLPRILDEQTYKSIFPDPHRCVPAIPVLRENGLPLMPVEFSVAAYRFGHSMVRPHYRLNELVDRLIFAFAGGDAADLGGLRPIPTDWAIDWQFFIDLDHGAEPRAGDPRSGAVVRMPQLSYKIDTSLVNPLGFLPARIAAHPANLALRNLERGVTFQLPSGQSVATAMGMQVLSDEELVIGKATAGSPKMPVKEIADCFGGNVPLWAYILSEAQVTSWAKAAPGAAENAIPVKLGPLGSRLVAEVFASLLRGDTTSYLNARPEFSPIAAFAHAGEFGLAELINIALGRAP